MTPSLLAALPATLAFAASLAASLGASAATLPGRLNDTGITQCMSRSGGLHGDCAASGQDAQYGRDARRADETDGRVGFAFTKLDAAGRPLPAEATQWACVRDRVTGLVWEMKTDDGGLHDKDNKFTNHGDGRPGDASAQAARVNETALCGRADWRLPTRAELLGIVDYSTTYPGPTVDSAWFPYGEGYSFWTATPQASNDFSKWYVNFQEGNNAALNSDYAFGLVRLVSGGKPAPAERYRVIAGGSEIADTATGLVWQRCVIGQTWNGTACAGSAARLDWREALAQAASASAASSTPWRLPDVKELASLVDDSRYQPSIDTAAFPNTPSQLHWSGSPYASFPLYAWTVYYFNGSVTSQATLDRYAARLVRTPVRHD